MIVRAEFTTRVVWRNKRLGLTERHEAVYRIGVALDLTSWLGLILEKNIRLGMVNHARRPDKNDVLLLRVGLGILRGQSCSFDRILEHERLDPKSWSHLCMRGSILNHDVTINLCMLYSNYTVLVVCAETRE